MEKLDVVMMRIAVLDYFVTKSMEMKQHFVTTLIVIFSRQIGFNHTLGITTKVILFIF